jgi:nicotinate-nucleotide pyrophosphorylase (carboxylating)
MEINARELEQFIDIAIREDIGDGDHTSLATISANQTGKVHLLVKEPGVIAGIEVARMVIHKLDPNAQFNPILKDGDRVKKGDIAFTAEGKTIALLQAERLLLNIMQRMSGIATQTSIYVEKLKGTHTKVLDTRKTTPGMRLLDKYSVKTGGGVNHRIGLYDMILIKDNHIDFAGGIENALSKTFEYLQKNGKNLKVECEARSLDDVKRIMAFGGVFRILLDNFNPAQTREAVAYINKRVETESSGNITLDNIRDYAECGVDYISVGALTHQIKSLDLSLKAI